MPAKKTAAKKVPAKPPKKKTGPPPVAKNKLTDAGVRAIASMIVEGESYRDISAHFEVSLATLASWIEENPERSRVCARAREISAQTFDEQALEVVRGATDMFALAKAKEEAIHLRWRAKAANPRRYGEKMALGGADDLPPIKNAVSMTTEQLMAIAAGAKT
jgi:hypothetical protein